MVELPVACKRCNRSLLGYLGDVLYVALCKYCEDVAYRKGFLKGKEEKEGETEILYCSFLCKRETAHKQIGLHKLQCTVCAAEFEEVYCHECSKAGGAGLPIYHLPPACKRKEDD